MWFRLLNPDRLGFACEMVSTDFLPRSRGLIVAACLFLSLIAAQAADKIPSAEATLERFRAACESEIKQAVSPDTMKRIEALRESPFLMIARKTHVDVTEFLDPKMAAAIAHEPLYGSQSALEKSTGDVWVLTYGNMTSLTVYLDAASGAVLCIAYIPEG
jgi:hypothetical protein